MDWAISDNIMKKYATNYPIVATGVGDNIPEGYSKNPLEQLMPDIDFNKLASERDSILQEWTNRYDAKSEPEDCAESDQLRNQPRGIRLSPGSFRLREVYLAQNYRRPGLPDGRTNIH